MVNTKDLPAAERSSREATPITEALPSLSRSIWKVISRWLLPLHSHQDLPLIVTRRAAHSYPPIPQRQPLTRCQCIFSFQKCYFSFELNCAHTAAAFQILISHTVINSPFVNFYRCSRSMKSENQTMHSLLFSCTLWRRIVFRRRLKKWALLLSLGKAEGLRWVKKCFGVRTWSSPSLSHPPSMLMIDINLSSLLWCQQNHFIWAVARRTVADSPPVVIFPPSSSSEFRRTLHRVAVCLLGHCSSLCLISCFLPGACISD